MNSGLILVARRGARRFVRAPPSTPQASAPRLIIIIIIIITIIIIMISRRRGVTCLLVRPLRNAMVT